MQLNIYELLKWLNENKSKIDQATIKTIHRTYKRGIILELYKPGLEKKYLYIIPGFCVFLSKTKLKFPSDSFVMRLRKDFSGKRVEVDILDLERVVVVKPSDSEKYLVVELFPPGNIIVLKENKVEYAQEYKDFGIRKIYKNEVYETPPSNFKIPKTYEDFEKIIKNSDKRDLARTLAIDLKLGKKYTELLLEPYKEFKQKSPKEIPNNIIKELWKKYSEFVNSPKIFLDKWVENVNDSLEEFYLKFLENEELYLLEEKKRKLLNILEAQKNSLESVQMKIEKFNLIGDFLSTYSWVFDSKDPEKIKENLNILGIDAKVKREGSKIIVDIKEEEIKKLLGYST